MTIVRLLRRAITVPAMADWLENLIGCDMLAGLWLPPLEAHFKRIVGA